MCITCAAPITKLWYVCCSTFCCYFCDNSTCFKIMFFNRYCCSSCLIIIISIYSIIIIICHWNYWQNWINCKLLWCKTTVFNIISNISCHISIWNIKCIITICIIMYGCSMNCIITIWCCSTNDSPIWYIRQNVICWCDINIYIICIKIALNNVYCGSSFSFKISRFLKTGISIIIIIINFNSWCCFINRKRQIFSTAVSCIIYSCYSYNNIITIIHILVNNKTFC